MIAICEEYAKEFNIKFIGKKSKLQIFKGNACKIGINKIEVSGDTIHSSTMADHLGHRTVVSDKDSMISAAIASFWKAFNLLMSDFRGLYSFIKCKLFKQYCCSVYGSKVMAFN